MAPKDIKRSVFMIRLLLEPRLTMIFLEWKKQLKIGGRITAPVKNGIVVIDKIGKNEYSKKEYFGFSFVPLITNK